MLRKIVKFYLYTNLQVALVAIALCLFSSLLFLLPLDRNYLIFIFFATLFGYGIHYLLMDVEKHKSEHPERKNNLKEYQDHVKLYSIFSAVLMGMYFFRLSQFQQMGMVVLGLVTLIYIAPVLPGRRRLRDFPFVKIFVLSIVWTAVTYSLRAVELHETFPKMLLLSVERFLFIFALAIPFDIRDLRDDKLNDTMTIVARIGIDRSKLLAYICLLGSSIILLYCLYMHQLPRSYFIAAIMAYIIAIPLIQSADEKKSDLFYLGVLDGVHLLPLLFAYLLLMV